MSFQMTSHGGHPKPLKSCVFNDCIYLNLLEFVVNPEVVKT